MIFRVDITAEVMAKAAAQFPLERSPEGAPSSYDFVGGPLAAAVFAFRDFGSLSYDVVPAVRSYMIPDPVFGAVVFSGVLVDGVVQIADFAVDPDYWTLVDDDPDG